MNVFLEKLRHRLARTNGTPLTERLRENGVAAARYLQHAGSALLTLRGCTKVGAWARTSGGAPYVDNRGKILLGSHVLLMNDFSPVQLTAAPGAVLELGDRTTVNFGTMFSAQAQIAIGRGVSFGPYCIVSDHAHPASSGAALDCAPITIEDGVWLAGRVTVLPGAKIGARSVITAGSIVSGEIPAGVVAGGNPARVLRRLSGDADPTPYIGPIIGPENANEAGSLVPAAKPARGAATLDALVIADFTADELARMLSENPELPVIDAQLAPFDQVVPTLLGLASGSEVPDVQIVWCRPQTAVPSFQRLLRFESVEESVLLEEVDAFAQLLQTAMARSKCGIVPSWTLPAHLRGLGSADAQKGGLMRALYAMNLRLMSRLEESPHIHVLNAQRWQEGAGHPAHAVKLWYLGKVAFQSSVFVEAVADIKAALRGLQGQARKLVVVDLDDTLWGGILGDDGWENLRLGGHDAVGESFRDFQQALKDLKQRGVLLALASKNDEATALDAIRKHPQMVLREEDFVAWRINWTDKANNIAELARELNLGLQSVVFIDDNPVERGRVREQLPEVLVPEWPEDKLLYVPALHGLRCFDSPTRTAEDAGRTEMYRAERARVQPTVGSHDDWVASLGLVVRVSPLGGANVARASQLLNKTNQLNLATRRLTQNELTAWAAAHQREVLTISVSDRYGDAGLTGLVSVERRGTTVHVVDYLLSCRVMGRKIEETLVHIAVESAKRLGGERVEARLLPTSKNKPCSTFWHRSGFESPEENVFTWNLATPYPRPLAISLEYEPTPLDATG